MRIKINVTKEILEQAKNCGTLSGDPIATGYRCAIALAVKEIFPNAYVYNEHIATARRHEDNYPIELPIAAQYFIRQFDSLVSSPEKRLDLTPLSFDVDVPEEFIEQIGLQRTGNHSL